MDLIREIISVEEARARGLLRYFTGKPCKNGHTAERQTSNKSCLRCIREQRSIGRTSGHVRYFNGKPCPKGHIAERYFSNDGCIACAAERAASAQVREYAREYKRQWYAANTATHKERTQKWYLDNIDKVRQYRADTAERIRELGRRRYKANPEHYRELARRWNKANPEKKLVWARNYRARSRNAPGEHTREDIQFLYVIQDNCCAACDASFDKVKAHVDHIVALANGGTNWPDNLQLLCESCNSSKQDRDWEDWLLERMLQTKQEAI